MAYRRNIYFSKAKLLHINFVFNANFRELKINHGYDIYVIEVH